MDYTPIFLPENLSDFVAEWSKASDHFRSFGQKLGWGWGSKFFLIFSKIDLRPNLIFTLFFKPYVTFLCIFMANFLKMAPLFTFEPTVDCQGQGFDELSMEE